MAAPEPGVLSSAPVPGKAWSPDLGVLAGPVCSLPSLPPVIYSLALFLASFRCPLFWASPPVLTRPE